MKRRRNITSHSDNFACTLKFFTCAVLAVFTTISMLLSQVTIDDDRGIMTLIRSTPQPQQQLHSSEDVTTLANIASSRAHATERSVTRDSVNAIAEEAQKALHDAKLQRERIESELEQIAEAKPKRSDSSHSSTSKTTRAILRSSEAVREERRDQILVLAMHHSGTSLITRILIEMGLYGGELSDFKMMKKKLGKGKIPPKFWERLDIVEANEMAVREAGVPEIDPGWLTGFQFRSSNVNNYTHVRYNSLYNQAIQILESRRPWVMKEPRMCITAPLWRPLLPDSGSRALCVLLIRHPYHVATGLRSRPRNRRMMLSQWLSLWEKYQRGAVNACAGLPKVLVSHAKFAHSPFNTVQKLYEDLRAANVPGIQPVSEQWLLDFLPQHEAKPVLAEHSSLVSEAHRELYDLFESVSVITYEPCASSAAADCWQRDVLSAEERKSLESPISVYPQPTVSFTRLMEKHSRASSVLIVPVNTFFSDLARNLICSWRRVATRSAAFAAVSPVVVGLDDHLCNAMKGINAPCFYNESFGVGIVDHQRWTLKADSKYMAILRLKITYALQVLQSGYDVLLSDADIVFLEDPFEYFSAGREDIDLYIQSDSRPAVQKKVNWICAGFFYMRSNLRTILFLQQVLDLMQIYGAPDQDVFELLLHGSGQNFVFPEGWRQPSSSDKQFQSAHEIGLQYRVLDLSLFPNGGRFFNPNRKAEERAVIVHANMRGYPQKVAAFKRKRLWFLNSMDVDKCN